MPNNFRIITFSSSCVGKHIKWSKKLYIWKVQIGFEAHTLQFFESKFSGRRRAFLNEKLYLFARKTRQLGQYPLRIRSHMILIYEKKDHSFDLKFFSDYFKALKIIPLPESELYKTTCSTCDTCQSNNNEIMMRSISCYETLSPYINIENINNESDEVAHKDNFNTYREAVDALSFAKKTKIRKWLTEDSRFERSKSDYTRAASTESYIFRD
ncbi:unnamed protein product [Blepharisma stoltei]|uniref:Site-specific DNA endonuclease n=1 Tax=Blepharisma stoltei TaxID=1481888 RepID=A0AAU9K271_9CILI|nr:unnamed protein product [Blepharisma stoltei]